MFWRLTRSCEAIQARYTRDTEFAVSLHHMVQPCEEHATIKTRVEGIETLSLHTSVGHEASEAATFDKLFPHTEFREITEAITMVGASIRPGG